MNENYSYLVNREVEFLVVVLSDTDCKSEMMVVAPSLVLC